MESVKKRFNDLKNKLSVPVNDLLANIPYNSPLKTTPTLPTNNINDINDNISSNNNNEITQFQLDSDINDNISNSTFMQSKFKIITVQISDSILSISKKYNMTEESLVILNRLDTVHSNLYPGQRLVVGSDYNIPLSDNSSLHNEIKDVLDYKLLLPRLRDKYDVVCYNKEINTLDGYNDIQHYESEQEKDKSRQVLYQLDNIIFITDNDVQLNGYITIKSELFTFIPSSLNFSFNKFEFKISSITAWNINVDSKVAEGEQVDSQRLLLRIYLDYYIDKSFMKSFQIHLDKSNNSAQDQNLVQELQNSLALYFKKEMLEQIDEESIYKPPTPPVTSSIWDKYLTQPIPYYTSSNPLSKSNMTFLSPKLLNNNTQNNNQSNSSSNNVNNSNNDTVTVGSPDLKVQQALSPLSPLLAIKSDEIYKYSLFYCFGGENNSKVSGILTLLPSRVIFQVDINDPIVKKEGSLKYQLHFTMDHILSCQLIPKINTFTKSIDDLQFQLDDSTSNNNNNSNSTSPKLSLPPLSVSTPYLNISSPPTTDSSSIHLIIVEQVGVTGDNYVEKDIIFESNENDINTIYKLIKEWMGQVTTPIVTPIVNSNRITNSNSVTKDKSSITSNLFALSTSMVDKLFDLTTSYGITSGDTNYDGDGDVYQIDEEEIDDHYNIISSFQPKLIHDSLTPIVFREEDIKPLFIYLPTMCQLHDWNLLYKSETHGISMTTLYSRTRDKGPCVLFIKDKNLSVFGAFISESIKPIPPKTYYGSGECFIFRLKPQFEIFLNSKENQCFVQSTDDYFSIGGGNDGKYAIWIDQYLNNGCTYPCITFDSQPLTTEDFQILDIEIWGFQ